MPTIYLGDHADTNADATVIDDAFFGSVVRAKSSDNTIELDGSGSPELEAKFLEAVEYLGVTTIRWPGGTEAEVGPRNGEIGADEKREHTPFDWTSDEPGAENFNVADLEKVLLFCKENGLKLSFTFPTSVFADGDDVDAQAQSIKKFIQADLIGKAAEFGVEISSIKIGNEYNVHNMTAAQYGDIASRLAETIGSVVPSPGPSILIEGGVFWEYGSGDTDLDNDGIRNADDDDIDGDGILNVDERDTDGDGKINDNDDDDDGDGIPDAQDDDDDGDGILDIDDDDHALDNHVTDPTQDYEEIVAAFSATEASYVDGIDIHHISLRTDSYDRQFGAEEDGDKTLGQLYDQLIAHWQAADQFAGSDLEFHTLAWRPERTSLDQAAMTVLNLYEVSRAGMDGAMNFLASGWGKEADLYNGGPTAAGEMFRLMGENLKGMKAVEFAADPSVYLSDDTSTDDFVIRAFEKDGQVVLYVANLENAGQTFTLAQVYAMLSSAGFDTQKIANLRDSEDLHIWASKLGVEDDGDPDTNDALDWSATPTIDIFNHADLLEEGNDWRLKFDLGAHEVMQIVLTSEEAGGVTMNGYSGADELVGSAWADELFGEDGDDTLSGGDGDDYLYGQDGDDYLSGGAGDDHYDGGDGADFADLRDTNGGGVWFDLAQGISWGVYSGSDTYVNIEKVWGSRYNDTILGTDERDILIGGGGHDTVRGRGGNDVIYGGWGHDVIDGGAGDDFIHGDHFNDTYTGGAGADTFVFTQHADTITDFDASEGDMIQFDDALWGGGAKTDAELLAYASVVGGNLVFDFGGGHTLTLTGVTDESQLEGLMSVI